MSTLWDDIRYAARRLRLAPGFTLVALLTLTLGIGANIAIFSVVQGVLLQPLPYAEPDELVHAGHYYAANNLEAATSPVGFEFYRSEQRVFSNLTVFTGWSATLSSSTGPSRLTGMQVSPSYWATFGLTPAIGRDFRSEEATEGLNRVVIISNELWKGRFGGDSAIRGRSLNINGLPYEVVGVMPPRIAISRAIDIWTPLVFSESDLDPAAWGNEWLTMVGRLAPGETVETAARDLERMAVLVRGNPATARDAGWGFFIKPIRETLLGSVRPVLLLLMGAAGLVLLIACANLANLLLARGKGRERETAVRMALGAGRRRLVRQLLTESLLLAGVGTITGVGLAGAGIRGMMAAGLIAVPRSGDIRLDTTVILFAAGLGVSVGLLFGVVPAFRLAGSSLAPIIKGGARETVRGLRGGAGVRNGLVVAQFALSLVLLAGAGLMLKTLGRLLNVDYGFRPDRVATLQLSLPTTRYPDAAARADMAVRLMADLRSLPGVESVGAAMGFPMSGQSWTSSFDVVGYVPAEGERDPWGDMAITTPGYFDAMGIALIDGRGFTDADRAGAPKVVVVDEALARTYWGGRSPLGERIRVANSEWEVVGVVRHVVRSNAREDRHVQVYFPHAQRPSRDLVVALRTSMDDPMQVLGGVRNAVAGLDPELATYDPATMATRLATSNAQPRLLAILLSLFAGLAMLLAGLGAFGVMSYMVGRQTREIGIRIALGAQAATVRRLVLGHGVGLAGLGILLGMGSALLLGRLMEAQLFGVSRWDLSTLVAVSLVLFGVSMAAAYVPTRRALRIDPIQTLREE